MGHSISCGAVTDLYIQTYPLAQQIQFNSKLLKVGEQAMLMDQLYDLSIEFLKSWGNLGKWLKKSRGNRGFGCIKSRGNRERFLLVVDYLQFIIIFAGKYERYGKKSI